MATRKKDVVQSDLTPVLDETNTAPTSDGAPRPNASPAEIAADEWFDAANTAANIAAIQAVAGEIEGSSNEGWMKTNAAANTVAVDTAHLLNWYPDSGDAFDKKVSDFTYQVKPDASAAAQKLLSNIVFHTVCASSETVANTARYGVPTAPTGNVDKPKFGAVRKRFVKSAAGVPLEKRKPGIWYGTEAECAAFMAKQAAEATKGGDTHAASLWQSGINAVDDVDKIRRLASNLANIAVYKTRYRCIFYVGQCKPLFDAYEAERPAKPLADLWRKGLIAAGSAHKAYMNECADKSVAPSATGLEAAIKQAVWVDLLSPNIMLEKKIKSDDEERDAVLNALFRAAEKLDKLVTGARMVEKGLMRRIEDLRSDLPDVAALIYDPKKRASEEANAEATRVRQEKEASERTALDKAAKEASDAEATAKAARKAEREAKKSEGPTPRAADVGASHDNGVNLDEDKKARMIARARANKSK